MYYVDALPKAKVFPCKPKILYDTLHDYYARPFTLPFMYLHPLRIHFNPIKVRPSEENVKSRQEMLYCTNYST